MPNSNLKTSIPKTRMSRAELDSIGVSAENVLVTLMPDDSMNMAKGDTIYIDTARNYIKDGNIFAFEMDGYFYCKRLYKTADGINIVSDAEGYPDKQFTYEQLVELDFKVIGWLFKHEHFQQWETTLLVSPERLANKDTFPKSREVSA